MEDYILEMRNIDKSYGGIHALKNVSIGLKRGEVLCLCGENGAGKSTLMKILAGVEKPTDGEIYRRKESGDREAGGRISFRHQYGASGIDSD